MTEERVHSKKRRTWMFIGMPLVVVAVTLLAAVAPAGTARAHGATTSPASRTYACYLDAIGPSGPRPASNPACAAAVAESGTQPLYDWFGVLRSDGAGRTRGFIPDGQLCSGGNTKYASYDAPRADWPATNMQSGAQYEFVYGAWVPHPGGFRFYITKDNYDPTKPLTWDEMEDQPFLTVDPEPSVVDGAYHMVGTVPAGKKGRHIIYVVWFRSDSTETFYSCSDVVFGGGTTTPTPTAGSTPSATPVVTPTPTRAVTPTPTRAVTPTPTTSASGSCRVSYVVNQWSGGFTANLTITNTGSATVNGWTLKFTFPGNQQVTQGWNGVFSQSGNQVTITNASYNGSIPPNSSVNPGFNGSWSGSNPSPTAFTLNGTACSVA